MRLTERFKSLVTWGKKKFIKGQEIFEKITKKIVLPGFDGVPLYDALIFFYRGNLKSSIDLRASAISFDIILAMLPAIMFFFTLIPYLPIPDLHKTIMSALQESMPTNAFETIRSTIEDVVSRQQSGLLSIGFLLSIYFASNGMITVMKAFNQSAHAIETRSAFWQRILSLVLVFILTVLIIVASIIQIISYNALDLFNQKFLIDPLLFKILFLLVKYLIIIIISFGAFSFIYYLAPAYRGRFRFISPGSTLATILTIIVLEVFSFFINNFGQYNKIYGSIGSMIVLIIWLNLNSRILLIGFELNASIYSAKKDKIMRDNNLEK